MDLDDLSARLWAATAKRVAIPPLTAGVADLTVADAYAVQDAVLDRHRADGARVTAAKLGLTSRAKQRQMHVDEPLYGWLTDRMLLADGRLTVSDYIQPRVEPEIAFLTGRELAGPALTAADVLAATSAVLPALDVLDSRFTGYRFTLADVTADNASAAGYVLGEPCGLDGDLRLTGCAFERNGELIATAAGAAVMEHPAAAVAWFVGKLAQRGRTLPAGSIVLAGAWTEALPVAQGDVLSASFDRIGSVELHAV